MHHNLINNPLIDLFTSQPHLARDIFGRKYFDQSKLNPVTPNTPHRGYIDGLTITPNTTNFTVGIGVCSDSTNVGNLVRSASIQKTLSAWVVGNTNGGLDTGTIAPSEWYHVYVIAKADLSIVDVLFSSSPTTPTMPATYTLKRRIGSFLTNSSSQLVTYIQTGDEFIWTTPIRDIAGAAGSTAGTLITLTVPPGFKVLVQYRASVRSSANVVLLTSPDEGNPDPNAAGDHWSIIGQALTANSGGHFITRTNTSGQIQQRATTSTSLTYNIWTYGWFDMRGKNL